MRGAQSDLLSPEMADKMVATLAEGTLTVVPEAGHSVAGDNPAGFHQAVSEFVHG